MNLLSHKKWLAPLAICAIGGVGLQFIRPSIENPPVMGDIAAPAHVKEILQRACYDCHSNETHLAWFDRISPAIWLVAEHVKDGRAAMNFSYWEKLPMDMQKALLFESLNQATFKTMPPSEYAALHPSANLTERDIAVLKDYLATLTEKSVPNAMKTSAADTQYASWTQAAATSPAPPTVKLSANGIAFIPEYKNWETISSTDRPDTGHMKVITGNDIAIKAVREHKTNPWPDGAILAKILYIGAPDETGVVRAGEFKQVGFMIKDSKKYASTQGWGYARWMGTQLEPGDKDPSFTSECVNCHAPMHDNDFVFTNPVDFSARQP